MELAAIVIVLALASGGIGVFFISRAAKQKERARAAEESLNGAREGHEIDEEWARKSAAAVDDSLHDSFRD